MLSHLFPHSCRPLAMMLSLALSSLSLFSSLALSSQRTSLALFLSLAISSRLRRVKKAVFMMLERCSRRERDSDERQGGVRDVVVVAVIEASREEGGVHDVVVGALSEESCKE